MAPTIVSSCAALHSTSYSPRRSPSHSPSHRRYISFRTSKLSPHNRGLLHNRSLVHNNRLYLEVKKQTRCGARTRDMHYTRCDQDRGEGDDGREPQKDSEKSFLEGLANKLEQLISDPNKEDPTRPQQDPQGTWLDAVLMGIALLVYIYIAMTLYRMYALAYDYFGFRTISELFTGSGGVHGMF
mmetsp:Transcript_26330/g.31934  ORF Transcript_26330/g.31934 Transcript_26330/m.31934 type:complete len:184 (+) Transcript_26330:418-969(+)